MCLAKLAVTQLSFSHFVAIANILHARIYVYLHLCLSFTHLNNLTHNGIRFLHFFILINRNIDLEELIAADAEVPNTCYDLIANIVHDGDPNEGKGSYRVHILHQVRNIQNMLGSAFVAELLATLQP